MKSLRSSALLFTTLVALLACAGSGEWLNSDRIERRFGSYGVDVLEDNGERRISSLYSSEASGKVTRTYAIVDYVGPAKAAYADVHERIRAGGSLGSSFRQAGWTVGKQHLFIGEFEVPPSYREIGELMQIELPATLATHHYLLTISRDERSYNYATVTEIHHPAYLTAAALREIYGEILFDDSNRDSIHDFIGAPRGN